MLYLQMYQAELPAEKHPLVTKLKVQIGTFLQPILKPMVETPAQILGVDFSTLLPDLRRVETYDPTSRAIDGEVFTDGAILVTLAVYVEPASSLSHFPEPGRIVAPHKLRIDLFSTTATPAVLPKVINAVEEIMGITPKPYTFTSNRFDELKSEGRESPPPQTQEESIASEVLSDKASRTLAIAIKASGGLLVRDLAKQLPAEAQARCSDLTNILKKAGLIDSEIVVVCSKTRAQVTRATNHEILNELSLKGLKCACGRLLVEEQIEEAVAITDLGRALLDKARWLTILVVQELESIGIARESILVEQTVGGDEVDCLANISGELALFELKDKEFNLGNAYSFGAKIGIIRPRHPVIVSTEYVGNDAKEHFIRARVSGTPRESSFFLRREEKNEITYIEGVEALRTGIRDLVSGIYKSDSARRLDQVLPLAALDGRSIVEAFSTIRDEKAKSATAIGPVS